MAAASLAPGLLPKRPVPCIDDELFIHTEAINRFFYENPHVRNGVLIFCSLCMDITVVVGMVIFVIHGKTWRLPLTLICFYALRFIMQKIFFMRFPDGYMWNYPGFPSLVVPYGATNDFFFSGHVGCATIFMLEYRLLALVMTRHRVFLR